MTPDCILGDRCTALHTDPTDHRDYGVTLTILLPGGEYAALHVHSFPTAQAAHEWAWGQYGRTVTDVLDNRHEQSWTIPGPDGARLACEDWLAEYEVADHYGRPITGHTVEYWTPHLPDHGRSGRAGEAGWGRINRGADDLTHTAYGLAFYDTYGDMVGDLGAVAYTEDGAATLAREWVGRRSSELPNDWREGDRDTLIATVSVDELLVRYTDADSVKGCLVTPPVECESTQGQAACVAFVNGSAREVVA